MNKAIVAAVLFILVLPGCVSRPEREAGHTAATPSWSIQYQGPIKVRNRTYQVVDLFEVTSADLKRLKTAGVLPIAYFSSQYEDWRPDSQKFAAADVGKPLVPWPGERWVNTESEIVRSIMRDRMDLAKQRGFYGVDVDNTDFFEHRTGFQNSLAMAVDYVRFLAQEAHSRGLKYSLKNSMDLIPMVRDVVDFYQNEECQQYGQAHLYDGVGPVFNIEYRRPTKVFRRDGFYSLLKKLDMGAWEREL